MPATPKVLIPMQDIPAVSANAYVSPSTGKGTWVDQFDVTNYSAGAITVDVWLIPAGGSEANSNQRVRLKSVAKDATADLTEVVGSFLNPGDTIKWKASAATSINGGASGREIT
jgi:hypothetical protein